MIEFETGLIYFIILLIILLCTIAAMIAWFFFYKKRQRLFMSSTAHDLKAPLSNINGYAAAMLEGTLTQEQKEAALAVISMETQRLARLADGLYSEKTQLNMTVFGLFDMLFRLRLAFENTAKRQNVSIGLCYCEIDSENSHEGNKKAFIRLDENNNEQSELPDEIYVTGDSDAIFEALFNLTNNAIKYCTNGEVLISVEKMRTEARLSVSNGSEIISKEHQKKLFKPYFRAQNAVGEGKGLGLYIASRLIKAHGKRLEIINDDGVWESTFFLNLASNE